MTEATETPDEPISAYDLLTKETLDISDVEAKIVIEDLRKKRKAYLAGQADNTTKKKRTPAKPTSAADKKANTAALLAGLNLKMPGDD